jgi:hypothetical protein
MALTTVKPSPACGMCRSESSRSKFSVAMRLSASRTVATASKASLLSLLYKIDQTELSVARRMEGQ